MSALTQDGYHTQPLTAPTSNAVFNCHNCWPDRLQSVSIKMATNYWAQGKL